ncbi:sensor histidine kinase [Polaribacter sp. M15]
MKRIAFYLFFYLLLIGAKTLAQHPVYYHLTEKDNLPDIEFYDIIEDNKGFIWLAANKGLFRYDGKVFTNYTHQKKRGLSVFGLKKDHKGRIWCNNISGQFFFIENNELNLFADLGDETNGSLTFFTFYNNNILIGTGSGIVSYNINNSSKKRKFNTEKLIKQKTSNDSLYTIVNNKIILSTKQSEPKTIYNFENRKELNLNQWAIYSYQNKELIYTYRANNNKIKPKLLYEIDNELREIKLPKFFESNEIINIYEVNNQLWFCTYSGVFTYTIKNRQLQQITTYFKGKDVGGLLKDRDYNYWFISLRNGIYIMPNLHIQKYEIPEDRNNISAMTKIDKNSLFIGSVDGGLITLNIESNKLNYLRKKAKYKVYDIEASKDNIFISLSKFSLIYNKKRKKYTIHRFLDNAKDFVVTDNHNVLYAAHNGARITNIDTKKRTILRNTRAYTIHYSKNNEIFVGYVDGVRKHPNNNQNIKIEFNKKPIIAIDIDETDNGIIWISTLKDGIIGIKNNKPLFNYTVKNGLLSNQAGKIKGDGNFLWVATDKSLQLLNTQTGTFKNITLKDGINSFSISEIIPFKNYIFFSSNKGLFKVHKEKVFITRKNLDFYITSILINDKKVEKKADYVLKSDQTKIKINFQTNGFLGNSDIIYSYKLLDDTNSNNWNTIEKGINQITFNNLAPGNYTIKLKAIQEGSDKKAMVKQIKLKIKTPYYKQLWFIFLMISFCFVILWFIILKNLRKKQRKQKQVIEKERMQRELITSKLETLQSQMNPHFTFNALNSIQNLVLKGKKQDAYNYLTKFSSLLRENLMLSNKSFVYFDEELSIIKKYLELEKLRFQNGFTYKITGAETIDNVKIPTMIIQPFIENAINHGLLHKTDGIGKIEIKFYLKETLKCVIIDNGIGIEASTIINTKNNRTKKSFSTNSISSKLKILKDHYKTNIGYKYEKIENGTKVIINIPYSFSDE